MAKLSGTGIAARAKEVDRQISSREAIQAQRFKLINSEDTAATTGRLVNPPAAVIPNPTGAGGQAGAQGAFGAMNSGATPQGAYGGSYNPTARLDVRTNQINALTGQTPRVGGLTPAAVGDNSGYGPIGYSGNVITGVNTVNNTSLLTNGGQAPIGHGSAPPVAINAFAGAQAGGGSTVVNPQNPFSSQYMGSTYVTPNIGFSNPHPYRQAQQPPVYSNPFSSQSLGDTYVTPYQQQPQVAPASYGGTAGYYAGYNQQQNIGFNNPHPYRQAQQRPAYPATSYMNPALRNSQSATQSPQGMQPPAANITPENFAQWQEYWNYQAQHPAETKAQVTADAIAKGKPDPFAPVVMTREQIWQMKARQRRRIAARATQDDMAMAQAAAMGYPVVEPSPYSGYTGNYYSTILNTGTG